MNIIMGAGDFAREVYEYHKFLGVKVAGFFDENSQVPELRKKPIYTNLDEIKEIEKMSFIVGTGNPQLNKRFFQTLIRKNLKIANPLICDSYVGENVKIGLGSVVCPKSVLTCDISVGSFCVINISCTIGHDCCLEDFCVISPNCSLSGHTKLSTKNFLGTNVVTIPKISVAEDSIIGASCVISKTIDQTGTYVGIPAKRIK